MLQPILPLPLLLPIALVVLGVVGWLCVVACRRLSRWWCGVCVTLALLASLCGLALLLNPGHVEQRPSAHAPIWVVGNDVSASMAAPVLDDPQAESRSAVAARVVQRLAEYPQRDVRWLALADGPLNPPLVAPRPSCRLWLRVSKRFAAVAERWQELC